MLNEQIAQLRARHQEVTAKLAEYDALKEEQERLAKAIVALAGHDPELVSAKPTRVTRKPRDPNAPKSSWRPSPTEPVTEDGARKVFDFVKANPGQHEPQIREACGFDLRASAILAELREAGKVRSEGQKRATTWFAVEGG